MTDLKVSNSLIAALFGDESADWLSENQKADVKKWAEENNICKESIDWCIDEEDTSLHYCPVLDIYDTVGIIKV